MELHAVACGARGRTVCSDGQSAATVNPKTGNATSAQQYQNGVISRKAQGAANPGPRMAMAYMSVQMALSAQRLRTSKAENNLRDESHRLIQNRAAHCR